MKTYTIPVAPGEQNHRVIPPIYRGDGVAIEVQVHDSEGVPVTNLALFDVFIALAKTPRWHPSNAPDLVRKHLVTGDGVIVMPGVVRFEFSEDDLSELMDRKSYYFNAWSRTANSAPVPQGTAILTVTQTFDASTMPPLPGGQVWSDANVWDDNSTWTEVA